MFLGTLYENSVIVLENLKWRIQYGGPNIEDLIICDVPREKGTNAENIANLFLASIDSFGVALSSKKIRKNF